MNEEKRVFAVRGAACCLNTAQSMQDAASDLYRAILEKNSIEESDIVSIQFTATSDLDAMNPASALRLQGLASDIPLFVSQEPNVKNSLPRTIRVMITFYGRKKPSAVYMNGAEVLRPDLS